MPILGYYSMMAVIKTDVSDERIASIFKVE
jgi:hypothetical protein